MERRCRRGTKPRKKCTGETWTQLWEWLFCLSGLVSCHQMSSYNNWMEQVKPTILRLDLHIHHKHTCHFAVKPEHTHTQDTAMLTIHANDVLANLAGLLRLGEPLKHLTQRPTLTCASISSDKRKFCSINVVCVVAAFILETCSLSPGSLFLLSWTPPTAQRIRYQDRFIYPRNYLHTVLIRKWRFLFCVFQQNFTNLFGQPVVCLLSPKVFPKCVQGVCGFSTVLVIQVTVMLEWTRVECFSC